MPHLKNICIFAHNWHWIPACQEVFSELQRREIPYSLFILRHPNQDYFTRLKELRETHPTLTGFDPKAWRTKVMRHVRRVPVLGDLINAFLGYQWTKAYLKKTYAKALMVTDDRALMYSLPVLVAAKHLRIPAILFPAETLMRVESIEQDKLAVMSYPSLIRRIMRALVERMYPVSVKVRAGKKFHFYSPRQILPFLFWPTFLPAMPWVRGSNTALAAVAVNSEEQKKEDAAHGVPEEKIHVTGYPPHDRFLIDLAQDKRALRERRGQTLGIPAGSKIFLIVGTHFRGTYSAADLPHVLQEVQEALRLLIAKVPAEYHIVVKLHPNTEAREWIDFFGTHERPVTCIHRESDAYGLVFIADAIFMFASSVVMATLATDIPVIAFRAQLPSFDAFYEPYTSVKKIDDVAALQRVLATLESPLSGELLANRRTDRARLGMFDGNNAKRLCDVLETYL